MVRFKFEQTKPVHQDKDILYRLNNLHEKFLLPLIVKSIQQSCHHL